ncbi:pentapeptide repeat-containing protein [Cellulomonas sp. URHB0016]
MAASAVLDVGLPASWTRAAPAIGVLVGLAVLAASLLFVDGRGGGQERSAAPASSTGRSFEDLRGETLSQSFTDSADLRGAALGGAVLASLDLRGVDLSGAQAAGIDLRDADLTGATLVGADLRGADLRGACLDRAELSGANLTGADASGASTVRTVVTPDQTAAASAWPEVGAAVRPCLSDR